MATLVIEHPVTDFDAWKAAFDSDPVARADHGVTRHAIYRPHDDPSSVVVTLEFASREQAETMLRALRDLWRRVAGELGFHRAEDVETRILDEVERVEYSS